MGQETNFSRSYKRKEEEKKNHPLNWGRKTTSWQASLHLRSVSHATDFWKLRMCAKPAPCSTMYSYSTGTVSALPITGTGDLQAVKPESGASVWTLFYTQFPDSFTKASGACLCYLATPDKPQLSPSWVILSPTHICVLSPVKPTSCSCLYRLHKTSCTHLLIVNGCIK